MESKKNIHVLYILTKLELGGAQKVCLTLLEGLQKKGILSSLISGTQGPLVTQAQKSNSVYLMQSFKREVGIKSLFNEFKTFIQLIKKIKTLKKNHKNLIVHTHSTKAGILGRWAAFFAGVKIRVHTVHGFGFHEFQNKIAWSIIFFFEYITAFITTHYVCVSDYDKKIGKKYLPKFWQKSSIIRAAVEWEKFYIPAKKIEEKFQAATKTSNFDNEKFIIGTVSCLKPQKNIFDLLKAFEKVTQEIKNKSLLLQIIGDGALRPEVEKWINQNNLQNKIELLGWQNDVPMWTKDWNLFAMSSLWEGLPCAVIEARLSKLPVLSYNIAGIPEVIFDGKNGFLIETGSWQMLAKRMEQLINNKVLQQKMSIYKDNLDDFQNGNMVEKHLQLYRQLV